MPRPEPVPLDRAECAFCRMLVSTERGAAELVTPDADTRFYDDVGCLAADWTSHSSGAHAFVRAEGGEWIDAAAAVFAKPAGARTAMGSGLVAFASAVDARAAGAEAAIMTFDDVVGAAGAGR
jgi:nitrous oxide reductase accessory protein NosL